MDAFAFAGLIYLLVLFVTFFLFVRVCIALIRFLEKDSKE